MVAQQARSLDDFILFDQLLLHPLAALAEEDGMPRAVLVRVSVSVSPWCLLEGCVQRVRVRPGEQGGRKKERYDTCQYCIVVGSPLTGLPGAVQAATGHVRGSGV